MKKILVTGATGFIGNYVVQELLKNNCSVIASSANAAKVEKFSWFPLVKYIPFTFEEFDNAKDYASFFGNPDAIIHLAWEGLPNYQSSFHLEINLPRHAAFLKNLISNGVKDITVTGTCFEYGMQQGCLNEETPAAPANPYSQAKDELRKYLQNLQTEMGFYLKWIRLFYMYGGGQSPNSLLSQLDRALANGEKVFNMSSGEQVRDYLPVEKVAKYIVKIALQNNITGIINCCSGIPVTVKQLVQDYLIENSRNISLNLGFYPYPVYEPMCFWGDNNKLKIITGNE